MNIDLKDIAVPIIDPGANPALSPGVNRQDDIGGPFERLAGTAISLNTTPVPGFESMGYCVGLK